MQHIDTAGVFAAGQRWRRAHHVLGSLIVLTWIIWFGLHLLHKKRVLGSDWQIAAPAVTNTSNTFGIYYKDQKIGFSETQRERQADGTTLFLDRAYWMFKTQGIPQKLALDTRAVVDEAWNLRRFEARIDAGIARINARGVVHDDRIDLEMLSGGRSQSFSVPLEGPILLPGLLRAYVAARDPQVGDSFELETYNPIVRVTEPVEVVVEERNENGWRISEIVRGSMKTSAWIDRTGATLREESSLGFSMRAEPPEQAMLMPEDADAVPDLVFAVAVPVTGEISDPASIRRLTLAVGGVKLSDFPDAEGGSQRRRGDQLEITSADWPLRAGYRPDPAATEAPAGLARSDFEANLASEPLIQTSDPRIRALARRIIGDATDAAPAALALARWLYKGVAKVNSVGVPSAVEVLETMRGDCNEHTVFYTALARSVGIPTRMAAGVVYADLRGAGPGFYYHAWPEVWLGDWVPVDPTLGQWPAHAGHVRFVLGGLDRQVDILRLIGTLSFEVIGIERSAVARGEPELPAGVEQGEQP